MTEDRLIDLETRIAYQEATLHTLNEIVTRQQLQLGDLERLCRHLTERVAKLGQDTFKGSAVDEVPPHY